MIVLAMHGAPPRDFPEKDAEELFGLHGRMAHADGAEREALEHRHAELEAKMRTWPRTLQNDPFHAGSIQLADQLSRASGCPVVTGFNEFCAPDLDEALDQAAARSGGRVVVVTPMMTRGGGHSEVDIPAAIQRAQARHPGIEIVYVWPFDLCEVADFLASQISRYVNREQTAHQLER